MTDFSDYLNTDGSPRVTTDDSDTPGTAARARTAAPAGVERGANGRFRSAAGRADLGDPVGSAAQTGAIDMDAVLRGLAAAERRDARAWPRALVAVVAIVAVVGLLGFCAWLVVYGHLFGL